MNNLIFPPADAKPAEIANALFVAMQNYPAYQDAAVHVVRLFHPLDLRTLQYLHKKIQEPNMRHQHPKGRDFQEGEAYAFARITEFLVNAIDQAGCEVVKTTEQ